ACSGRPAPTIRRAGRSRRDCYSAVMPNQRERGPWSGAWPWLLALLALCIVGVVIWLVATSDHTSSKGGSASPPVTSVPVDPVVPPSGALRVAGNQVLDSTGRQYMPYGFVVWCM